ncbi:MAG: TonB-dependent receptor plug domain-containing protein [Bacteroidales bacterium]|nr:TonB-dependent receptor plug domain-containing protein [Bacteroidales bacterium]
MKKNIIIIIFASVLIFLPLSAQEGKGGRKKLAGHVVTLTGDPVKGAMIFVDGKLINTGSNRKGIYKIKINPDSEIIAVLSESHGSEEALYMGQDSINFVLTGSFNASVFIPVEEEEYVDIGYGKVKRDQLTTSVGSVSKEKINQPHYTDIYSMIQGEVPGVTVTGERIIIRGIHTINANTDPLFVVDGVMASSISHINPMDVESIDILKGPAASIYGVNGANGVILINTRKAVRRK